MISSSLVGLPVVLVPVALPARAIGARRSVLVVAAARGALAWGRADVRRTRAALG